MANKNKVRRIKFFRVFLLSLAIFSVIAALLTTAYVLVTKNNLLGKVLQQPVLQTENPKTAVKDKAFTVVALFGAEQMGSSQIDTGMIVFFNHKNQEINVISVPRDTKFKWPEDIYTELSAKRTDLSKIVAFSEVPTYVSADRRNEVAKKVLENALHININYFINTDLAAFKYLVNVVGPVEMEVPAIAFEDTLKGRKVSFEKGLQALDGEKAAELLQYSEKYTGGDLNRIKVQQSFLKSLVAQILKPENKLNLASTMKGLYPYIQTDFNDAADYMVYLEQIHPDKMFIHTLPGNITSDDKFAYDSANLKSIMDKILVSGSASKPSTDEPKQEQPAPQAQDNKEQTNAESQTTPETAPAPAPTEPSGVVITEVYDTKIMPIGVYNGTNIAGLAAKNKIILESKGYKVAKTDNYPTKPVEKTIIKVYAKEIGEEFLAHYPKGVVQVDPALKGKAEEIVIVLGLTEN